MPAPAMKNKVVAAKIKKTLFLRGKKRCPFLDIVLKEFCALKQPNVVKYAKPERTSPFEDATSFEFYCKKNSASLFVFANSHKKNIVILGRVFDGVISDLLEIQVISSKAATISFSHKSPLFVFNKERTELHRSVKGLFLDHFRKNRSGKVSLSELELVFSLTFTGEKSFTIKTYVIKTNRELGFAEKNNCIMIRNILLRETGFEAECIITRIKQEHVESIPDIKKKTEVKFDLIGNAYACVHVGKQNTEEIRPCKKKAFKAIYYIKDS